MVLAWVHDSQDVSLDCCHLRLDWGWRIPLPDGSFMRVVRRPLFLLMWDSLWSHLGVITWRPASPKGMIQERARWKPQCLVTWAQNSLSELSYHLHKSDLLSIGGGYTGAGDHWGPSWRPATTGGEGRKQGALRSSVLASFGCHDRLLQT